MGVTPLPRALISPTLWIEKISFHKRKILLKISHFSSFSLILKINGVWFSSSSRACHENMARNNRLGSITFYNPLINFLGSYKHGTKLDVVQFDIRHQILHCKIVKKKDILSCLFFFLILKHSTVLNKLK